MWRYPTSVYFSLACLLAFTKLFTSLVISVVNKPNTLTMLSQQKFNTKVTICWCAKYQFYGIIPINFNSQVVPNTTGPRFLKGEKCYQLGNCYPLNSTNNEKHFVLLVPLTLTHWIVLYLSWWMVLFCFSSTGAVV